MASGAVTVEVTMNLQQYSAQGTMFDYRDVQLVSVSPAVGPIAGGTTIVVSGHNFHMSTHQGLWCEFDGTSVQATFESEHMISCVAPSASSPGLIQITMKNDGATYDSTIAFLYRSDPKVFSITPVAGMVEGGTLVTVFGTGFVSTVASQCKFADATVPA
eukprot:3177767-Prymnesium_polylepis.1